MVVPNRHGTKGIWVDSVLYLLCDLELWFDLRFSRSNFRKLYHRNRRVDWHGTKRMGVDRMLDPSCDFKLWPHLRPWPWIFKVLHIETKTKLPLFSRRYSKCIFFNENVWISIKISLKYVPKGPINNIPPLVQIMAWYRPGIIKRGTRQGPILGPLLFLAFINDMHSVSSVLGLYIICIRL